MSLRAIASTLAAEGYTTRGKGTAFNPKTVRPMVEMQAKRDVVLPSGGLRILVLDFDLLHVLDMRT